jgi:hypothetical protein
MEMTAQRSPARSRVARRGAAVAAALALALGAAACTGDEEQPAPSPSSEAAPTAGEPGTGASDGGGQEVTEADLDAATDRFLGFLQVIDDQDWEAACGVVLDPDTGAAPEGERRQACADGAQEAMGEYEQLLEPGAFDALDASMVRAEPAEDGTISLSVLEQDIDVPMIRGEDGDWYLSIPF